MPRLTWKSARMAILAFAVSTLAACSTTEPLPEAPPPDADGDGIYDAIDDCPYSGADMLVAADGCPRDSDGDGAPDYLDTCPDTPPGAAACAFGCEVSEPIVINLVNDEFDFDKSDLKPDMIAALDALIAELKDIPDIVDLTVVGHTDNFGTEEYNHALSLRRAQSVVDYLGANGLDHLNFTQHGKGESQPVADNATPEGRALNRRVEIYTHSAEEHCCSSILEPAGPLVAVAGRTASS